jgi:hypothetical protein
MHTVETMFAAAVVAMLGSCAPIGDEDTVEDEPAGDTATVEVRRATLACNFEFADTLDLETGEVTQLALADQPQAADLTCTMGRRIGLDAQVTPETCQADALYAEPERFDDVATMDDGCTLNGIWCNYLATNGYEPVCVGVGGVVVDRAGARYALRVVSDGMTGAPGAFVGEFEVEYAPLPAP